MVVLVGLIWLNLYELFKFSDVHHVINTHFQRKCFYTLYHAIVCGLSVLLVEDSIWTDGDVMTCLVSLGLSYWNLRIMIRLPVKLAGTEKQTNNVFTVFNSSYFHRFGEGLIFVIHAFRCLIFAQRKSISSPRSSLITVCVNLDGERERERERVSYS